MSANEADSLAAFQGQMPCGNSSSRPSHIETNSSTCNGSWRILGRIKSESASHGLQVLEPLLSAQSLENRALCSCLISLIHMPCCPIRSTNLTLLFSESRLSLILRTVSTTILCWDCLPVRNITTLGSGDFLDASSAAASAAAVLPIPVGAEASRKPPAPRAAIPSTIISP